MKSVLEQGRDMDSTRIEARSLERKMKSLISEVLQLAGGRGEGDGGGECLFFFFFF
jgi:hypothetical protein